MAGRVELHHSAGRDRLRPSLRSHPASLDANGGRLAGREIVKKSDGDVERALSRST